MLKTRMKWLIVLLTLLLVLAVLLFVFKKDYIVSEEDTFIPHSGSIDIYNASREELMEIDLCNYTEVFGEVKNAKEASRIAAKVIKEVYENDEYPYVVKYNKNADAWIVNGSLPPFHWGGVASIAIDRETGEVLMLLHTK